MKFIEDIKLDVIATYHTHQQEHFNCALTDESLESEDHLLSYVKEQLSHEDLAKLSLCWVFDDEKFLGYDTIKQSIDKNAKYYF